jgi:hypothetical protein
MYFLATLTTRRRLASVAFELLVYLLHRLGVGLLLKAGDLAHAGGAQDLGPHHLPDEVRGEAGDLGELLDGLHALLHLPCQLDLLLQGEEGHLADLVQVLAYGVGGGDLGEGQLLFLLQGLLRQELTFLQEGVLEVQEGLGVHEELGVGVLQLPQGGFQGLIRFRLQGLDLQLPAGLAAFLLLFHRLLLRLLQGRPPLTARSTL